MNHLKSVCRFDLMESPDRHIPSERKIIMLLNIMLLRKILIMLALPPVVRNNLVCHRVSHRVSRRVSFGSAASKPLSNQRVTHE